MKKDVRFTLIRKISEGSNGIVFLATDKHLNKKSILKIIPLKPNKTPEIEILQYLNNKHIVKLYSTTIIGDTIAVLSMEYIEGVDLYDFILEKKYLREKEALIIFNQLVEAIDFLHSRFVIHRDIKPENILIGKDGVVKLCDFGFSSFYKKNKKLWEFRICITRDIERGGV